MRISDWSSDVCSSDLVAPDDGAVAEDRLLLRRIGVPNRLGDQHHEGRIGMARDAEIVLHLVELRGVDGHEIGRASCRERVCQYVSISVVAVSFKKKNKHRELNNERYVVRHLST